MSAYWVDVFVLYTGKNKKSRQAYVFIALSLGLKAGIIHVLAVGQAGLAVVPVHEDSLHVLVEDWAALGGPEVDFSKFLLSLWNVRDIENTIIVRTYHEVSFGFSKQNSLCFQSHELFMNVEY